MKGDDMTLGPVLSQASGSWVGSNGFRLMPGDPLHKSPATATLSLAAGQCLATLGYTWTHPDDGPQDGLLALGRAGQDNAMVALWSDSWHQHLEAKVISGVLDENGPITLEYDYGDGWRWQIVLDASRGDALTGRMNNVVPAEAATADIPPGPYVAMDMVLHRPGSAVG